MASHHRPKTPPTLPTKNPDPISPPPDPKAKTLTPKITVHERKMSGKIERITLWKIEVKSVEWVIIVWCPK